MRLAWVFLAAALSASAAQDYNAYFLSQLDTLRHRYFLQPGAYVDALHLHHAACMAGAEARAFELTGNREYATSAVARMRAIAALLDKGEEGDFFLPYPFTWTYRALDQAAMLDPDLKNTIRNAVAKSFHARDVSDVFNQTLQRAAGLGLAAQTWSDLPQAKIWRDYAETIYRKEARMEDSPENSTNYNAFDLVFTPLLAEITFHPDLIHAKGIQAMYTRYRDQVSPTGFLPPYGDAGAAPQPFTPDWPTTNPWAMYVQAFDRAAAEYNDPTLTWAAQRLAEAGMAHEPLDSAYTGIIELFYFGLTLPPRAQPAAAPAVAPKIASAILTRADLAGPTQQDKLILAPSREPGAPFLLADLYVRGPHAHENQHGAVAYFEYNGQPLITALGYNNREPDQASLVMMRPAGDPFPSVPGVYPANEWREAILPTSRLPVVDPKRPNIRRIDALNVRIESSGVTAWVSNFRLAGKNTQALEAASKVEGWNPAPEADGDAIRWESPKGIVFHTKTMHAEFDCTEYPALAFRWKFSNNRQVALPIILRVVSGTVNTDYHAEAVQLEPLLDSARLEQKDADQYGEMNYSGWMTPDTTLRRQMVLTNSGVLVVRDRLTPGALAKGMVAGPVWQMTSDQMPKQNGNWFYSSGGAMELLTWFARTDERLVFGQQTTDIWSKKNQRAVFAKQELEPGKPVYFVSVLSPQARGADAAQAAAGIAVQNDAGGIAAQVGSLTIRVGDGQWSVAR